MAEASQQNSSEHIDEAELLRRFDEKRRLLETSGLKAETKQVFREAFREHVAEKTAPVPAPAPPADASVSPVPPAVPVSNNPAVKDELEFLVSMALEKGVLAAVKKAQAETPYLVDALHDELADHYYDKLIQSGQLKAE